VEKLGESSRALEFYENLLMPMNSGVPGQLRGLEYIRKRYGKLDWKTLIAPAIEVADTGFLFGHDMEWMVNWTLKNAPLLNSSQPNLFTQDPAWKPDFAPNGTLLKRGDIMTRKRYAGALRNISDNGAEDFYTGSTARTMLRAIRHYGGNMTERDLMNYTVVQREPKQVQYRNYTLTSTVAPSSGTVLLNILGVLDNYDDFFTNASTTNRSTHRMVEAIKFGYAYVCGSLSYGIASILEMNMLT
jgi:gamma-glutamyltranspeptidase/glutathione hydrolase